MRIVHKGDIKPLKIIHGNARGRVKAGGLVMGLDRFVIFLIYTKGILIRRDALYKIGCMR